MNVVSRPPAMSRDQFLDWAAGQEAPYEFDGLQPVAMTGGNRNHSRICRNLVFELQTRLIGSVFEVLPEAGVATVGSAVRYPDVVITQTAGSGRDRLIAEPVVVFEVVSPTSGRVDRLIKLREYRTVPSILRYAIVDNLGPDLATYTRAIGTTDWTADAFTASETLALPELGIAIPIDAVFRGAEFSASDGVA